MAKAKIEKREAMIARGIRFPEKQWKLLSAEAKQLGTTPSDIVRGMTKQRYWTKLKPR